MSLKKYVVDGIETTKEINRKMYNLFGHNTSDEKDTIIKILNERNKQLIDDNYQLTRKVKELKKDRDALIRSIKILKC